MPRRKLKPMSLPTNAYEQRIRNTEQKLQNALERLAKGDPQAKVLQNRPYKISVATLAKESGVARSTIYARHPAFVKEIAKAIQRKTIPDKIDSWEAKITEQRAVIDELTHQQRQLATENADLLARAISAERENKRLKKQNASLTRQLSKIQKLEPRVRA